SFNDQAVAEDLLQTTLLKIHRARGDFRPDLPVRPWIFTIAARVRLDEYRKRRRIPEPLDEDTLAQAEAAESDGQEAARVDGREAFDHARSCPACAAALAEGAALMTVLDGLLAPAAPPAAGLDGAAEVVRGELRRERWQRRRASAAIVVAVTAAWLLPLAGGL